MPSNRRETVDVRTRRLFSASCVALLATSISFAVVGAIMQPLKEQFVLTNEQVGFIGGAQLWGFTVSIFIFGPICDALGMKFLLRLALVGHLASVAIFFNAQGFWSLFAGALASGLGNGLVEAACNPLVATLYPNKKTEKLNQFHVWFPGGIFIGGISAYLLDAIGLDSWRLKLLLILVPTMAYGFLFLAQRFPATERVQSGIAPAAMIRATFLRPFFLVLLLCMMLTASVELGPGRWMPTVLGAAGIAGLLVLAWINGIMGFLRYFAGPVVHRLSPTGILLCSSILSGIGLLWLSYAETSLMAFAAATLFAVGTAYFWPTMLGVAAERVPRGGALALAVLAGTGTLIVGLVTTPQMGALGDREGHARLDPIGTRAVLEKALASQPSLESMAESGTIQDDLAASKKLIREVLRESESAGGTLPAVKTANALRSVIQSGGKELAVEAKSILDPAESHGGRLAFRMVSLLCVVLTVVFGAMFLKDRASGGYKAEKLAGMVDRS